MSSAAPVPILDPAVFFEQNLQLIERIVASITRRSAMNATDADEFSMWVKERLFDNDYSILRRFAGKSSLATYLSVVIANLHRDFRNAQWGRWRPSAEAERRGPIAVRLESLLWRDRYPLREAVEILRSSGCPLSEIAIKKLASELPARHSEREVALDDVLVGGSLAAPSREFTNHEVETQHIERALLAVIADLPPEDAVLVKLRYWSGLSIADVARTMHFEQKPLYRKFDAINQQLRSGLIARGFDQHRVQEFVGGERA